MSPQCWINELFDPCDLEAALAEGLVREQVHPSEPLRILNYTEKAQWEQEWDEVTLNCRGLIVNDLGQVVARPFRKFFNYGQDQAGPLDLSAKAAVVDKLDGSLGIAFPTTAGFAIATRGSFTSTQAIHATEVLNRCYPEFLPPEGVTVLFEIVYPENRIVCDYGGADDLFLLGGVDIATGQVLGPDEVYGWTGPAARVFTAPTLADALAMPPRPGAEGLVVRLVESGQMVKLKQEDYLNWHAIVTSLNARVVWEALGSGKTVAEICEPLPDELWRWVADLAGDLLMRADMRYHATEATYDGVREKLDQLHQGGWQRKEFALAVTKWVEDTSVRAWLFNLLDGRDPRPAIWKSLRPSGDLRPVSLSEDTA